MIRFFTEDVSFDTSLLSQVPSWILHVSSLENYDLGDVSYIFCSDEHLLQINMSYLQHDYYTDIITFDNSDSADFLEADIFISIERVQENSSLEQTSFFSELLRVIIHGILHLMHYDDTDENSKLLMRQMEDKYLDLYFKSFDNSGS